MKLVHHPIPSDKSTRLIATARGSRIEIYVNDESSPLIALTDDHITAAGQVGVRMYTTDNDRALSAFDNIHIVPLPPLSSEPSDVKATK